MTNVNNYLEVDSVNTYYGESHILYDLSLSVREGEVVSLLGRNGAGKTTTLRSIMGLTLPQSGTITFKGEDLSESKPYQRLRKGVAIVPENRVIFPNLTVLENLKVPRRGRDNSNNYTLEEVFKTFPILEEYKNRAGHGLSGGEQQMLAIARSMLANPDLLLLDEPSEGLAPQIIADVRDAIKRLSEHGITILLVEQNTALAQESADRHYIIEQGQIKFEGQFEDIDKETQEKLLSVG